MKLVLLSEDTRKWRIVIKLYTGNILERYYESESLDDAIRQARREYPKSEIMSANAKDLAYSKSHYETYELIMNEPGFGNFSVTQTAPSKEEAIKRAEEENPKSTAIKIRTLQKMH